MELFRERWRASSGNGYLETLRKRAKRSRVHSRHQLLGLLMAAYLDDRAHKTLYMRIAKRPDADYLLRIAKEVGSRRDVKNKGAYFMRVVSMIEPWKSSRSEVKSAKKSSVKKQRSLFSLISRKTRSAS